MLEAFERRSNNANKSLTLKVTIEVKVGKGVIGEAKSN